MCGIIGIIGNSDAAPRLVEGLRRLEYRGYDSAGVATLLADGSIERRRAEGKLANLDKRLQGEPLAGPEVQLDPTKGEGMEAADQDRKPLRDAACLHSAPGPSSDPDSLLSSFRNVSL